MTGLLVLVGAALAVLYTVAVIAIAPTGDDTARAVAPASDGDVVRLAARAIRDVVFGLYGVIGMLVGVVAALALLLAVLA